MDTINQKWETEKTSQTYNIISNKWNQKYIIARDKREFKPTRTHESIDQYITKIEKMNEKQNITNRYRLKFLGFPVTESKEQHSNFSVIPHQAYSDMIRNPYIVVVSLPSTLSLCIGQHVLIPSLQSLVRLLNVSTLVFALYSTSVSTATLIYPSNSTARPALSAIVSLYHSLLIPHISL